MDYSIERLVAEFLRDYNDNDSSSLERFVLRAPADQQESVLAELLAHDVAIRRQKGELPQCAEYISRFPAFEQVIIHAWPSVKLERADAQAALKDTPDHGGLQSTVDHQHVSASMAGEHEAFAELLGDDLSQIGRFRIVRPLGSGGFGQVFLAYDPSLDRMVAIKVLKQSRRDQSDVRERFLREGRAAARLRHPNIVAVYEANSGTAICGSKQQEIAYIASEYVEGRTLRQAMMRGVTWTQREAASMVSSIANAIGYAHQQGVTHRDIKPENIILSADGEPQILDFGLAGFDDAKDMLTGRHEVFGTPHYLSPEQLIFGSHQAGPGSDVWATGIVLYEILTGKRPFETTVLRDLMHKIPAEPIVSPCQLNPSISKDLAAICMKSLDRNVEQRYRDGAHLHQDMERYLVDIPVHARPLGMVRRLTRWARRRPGIAMLTAMVILVSSLGAGVSSILALRADDSAADARAKAEVADRESKRATAKSEEAQTQFLRAERGLYRARILLAQNYWLRGDAPRVRDELSVYRPGNPDGSPIEPGWEWYYLWGLVHKEAIVSQGHQSGINDVRISPDGKSVATAGTDGAVRLWNAEDGKSLAASDQSKGLNVVRFHPHGKTILSAGWDGKVAIRDANDLTLLRTIDCSSQSIIQMELGLDGTRIITSGKDQRVRIWNYESGELVKESGGKQFGEWEHRIAMSPDGKSVAFEGAGSITLLNVADGEVIRLIKEGHVLRSEVLHFSPNGKWLFSSGGMDPRFHRMDVPNDEPLLMPGESQVDQFTWAPNSVFFATLEREPQQPPKHVQVWSLTDDGFFQKESRLACSVRDVKTTVFTPDSTSIISGGENGVVQFWKVSDGSRDEFFPGHTGEITDIAVSDDGSMFYSAGHQDPSMRGWKRGTGRQTQRRQISGLRAMATVFDPNSPELLAVGWEMKSGLGDILSVPDLQDRGELDDSIRSGEMITDIAINSDGRMVAIAKGKSLQIINRSDPVQNRSFLCKNTLNSIAFHPNGQTILVGFDGGTAAIHSVDTAEPICEIGCRHRSTLRVAWHPEGRQFATAGYDGTVKVWDGDSLLQIEELEWSGWFVFSLAYSPDGSQLAAGSHIPMVKVWKTDDFTEVATLKGHAARVNSISFHPDGSRVATSGWDGSVRIWDCNTWQELCVIEVGAGAVFGCKFSPDGNYLALACEDGTVHLCNGRQVDK